MFSIGKFLGSLARSSAPKKADEATPTEGVPLLTDGKTGSGVPPKVVSELRAEIGESGTNREVATEGLKKVPYISKYRVGLKSTQPLPEGSVTLLTDRTLTVTPDETRSENL